MLLTGDEVVQATIREHPRGVHDPRAGDDGQGATGSKSEIVFQPLPQDDPVRRRPDISLAKAKLHWEPTIALRDGLVRTIEYFR